MSKKITAFVPYNGQDYTLRTIDQLNASEYVEKVYVLVTDKNTKDVKDCGRIEVSNLFSAEAVKKMAEKAENAYSLIITKDSHLDFGQFAIERFFNVAEDTGAGLVYSDYYEEKSGVMEKHPVIDYQEGSLRDDFNFGTVLFYSSDAVRFAANENHAGYKYAGFYDLRLKTSQNHTLVRVPEYLYSIVETDTRKSGEKLFDYVDPKNRQVQVEMEEACTDHLKKTGAYLAPEFKYIDPDEGEFPVEATVIIPVRDRVKTIGDAIGSVLKQTPDFKFNLIVVDNYSTDGTTDIIKKFAKDDKRLIHLVPERKDLQIGGCWNEAVQSEYCGRYAVQLDSDDMYKDETTLQKIVDTFRKEKCAAVIGSYMMTDFNLKELPPGLIDHKEWTPDNGRNNALRINGLGAPRAFYTPVLRKLKIPNVSYGEDYALGLNISREYQIGRIYEALYMCRRWEGNSDAALSVEKVNANNTYKDRIRTYEYIARKRKNAKK